MAYNVGTAELAVAPSFDGVMTSIAREAQKWGQRAGDSFSRAFNSRVGDETGRAPVGPSEPRTRRQGEQSGGAFAAGFRKQVESALKSLPEPKIGVATSEAEQKIRDLHSRLRELSGQTVGVDVDAASAIQEVRQIQAELNRLAQESPDVNVRVDTGRADAQLSALLREVEKLDGRRAEVEVDIDTDRASRASGLLSSAFQRVSGVAGGLSGALTNVGSSAVSSAPGLIATAASAQALVSASFALIPTITTLGASIAALLPAAVGAGAAFGVLASAFGSVSDVLDLYEKAQEDAGNTAAKSALEAFNQAAQVEAAQERISDAIRNQAKVAAEGERSVAKAEEGVGKAVEQAAERVSDAASRVRDAQEDRAKSIEDANRRLARAEEDGARAVQKAAARTAEAVEDGARAVEDAERRTADARGRAAEIVERAQESVERAISREIDAQEDVIRARERAKESIEDLARAARGSALDEEQAALSVERAAERINEIQAEIAKGSTRYTQLDLRQAQLDLRDRENDLRNAREDNTEAQNKATDAARKGVEGSDLVVAAKKAEAEATREVAEANRDLQKSRSEAARVVADALRAEAKARDSAADSVRAARLAEQQAAQNAAEAISDAERAVADARAKGDRSVQDAEENLAKARRDGARAVQDAQDALTEAVEKAAEANANAADQTADAAAAYEKLRKQMELQAAAADSTKTAQQKLNEELAKHGPNFRSFIDQLISTKDRLAEVGFAIEESTLPGFTRLLQAVEGLVPDLQKQATKIGAIFSGTADNIGDYLSSAEFKSKFNSIGDSLGRVFEDISDIVERLLPTIVTLTDAAGPVLEEISGLLLRIVERFADWIAEADRSGKLQTFFDKVASALDKTFEIGGVVFDILTDIFGILFPNSADSANSFLDGALEAVKALRDFLKNETVVNFLKQMVFQITEISRILGPVVVPAIILFVSAVATIAAPIIGTVYAIAKLVEAVVDMADKFVKNINVVVAAVKFLSSRSKEDYAALQTALKERTEQGGRDINNATRKFTTENENLYSGSQTRIKDGTARFGTELKADLEKKLSETNANTTRTWGDINTKWSGEQASIRSKTAAWAESNRKTIVDSTDQANRQSTANWVSTQSNWVRIFTAIQASTTGLARGIVTVFAGLAASITPGLNGVVSVVNAAINGINAILPTNLRIKTIASVSAPRAQIGRFATGGYVSGPGTGTSDSIPAMLSNGEYVIRAKAVKKIGKRQLDELNRAGYDYGGDPSAIRIAKGTVPRFANGGLVERTKDFIRSTDPLPYVFGAVGPRAYDCSGITGEVFNRLTGRASNTRRFVTGSNFQALGFRRGKGTYTIGVTVPGAHMVGNLDGLAFEAGSPARGIMIGSAAQSVDKFPDQYYLPMAGDKFIASGSGVGGDGIGSAIADLITKGLSPLSKVGNIGGIGAVVPAIAQAASSAIKTFVVDKFGASVDGSVAPNVNAPATVVGWIKAAMAATGVSGAKWLNGMLTLTKRESNWNPNAVNNWDSNAAKGTPSKGIAQTIGPTYDFYRERSLPNNIFDPISNIAASINYILDNYGDISNVQQANPNLPPKGYMNGGIWRPGDLGINETSKPEYVFNQTQWDAIRAGGLHGRDDMSLDIYIHDGDVVKVARTEINRTLNSMANVAIYNNA